MTDWLVASMIRADAKYPSAKADRIAAAGGDLVMPGCMADHKHILEALDNGTLDRQQLLRNATRVSRMITKLTTKEKQLS